LVEYNLAWIEQACDYDEKDHENRHTDCKRIVGTFRRDNDLWRGNDLGRDDLLGKYDLLGNSLGRNDLGRTEWFRTNLGHDIVNRDAGKNNVGRRNNLHACGWFSLPIGRNILGYLSASKPHGCES
jgi:hypothetical protein